MLFRSLATTPQTTSAVLVAQREEPVLAKKSTASPSPELRDKEAPSTSLQPLDEPLQAQLQENLDKDSTKPPEEPTAATTTTALVEHPVYFVSTVLRDARERYSMQQKLLFSLLRASRKLRHYFQGHPNQWSTSASARSSHQRQQVEYQTAGCPQAIAC